MSGRTKRPDQIESFQIPRPINKAQDSDFHLQHSLLDASGILRTTNTMPVNALERYHTPRTTGTTNSIAVEVPFYQLEHVGKRPARYFAARPELEQIRLSFAKPQTDRTEPKILCLMGLRGAGKTQLILQ